MHSTERTEFENQLKALCAGFNVPVGDRIEAYWAGLQKMGLIEFTRVVEFALGESGPDKIPTTKHCWQIRNQLKRGTTTTATKSATPNHEPDHLLFFANRLFFKFLALRGGVGTVGHYAGHGGIECTHGSATLDELRRALRDLVDWYAAPIRESDAFATPAAFVADFIRAMQKIAPFTDAMRDALDPRLQ